MVDILYFQFSPCNGVIVLSQEKKTHLSSLVIWVNRTKKEKKRNQCFESKLL